MLLSSRAVIVTRLNMLVLGAGLFRQLVVQQPLVMFPPCTHVCVCVVGGGVVRVTSMHVDAL